MIRGKDHALSKFDPMARLLAALVGCLLLAGCFGSGGVDFVQHGVQQQQPPQTQQPTGEVLGSGPVTIALLLPLTAGGSASGLAQSFRNAAMLALDEAAASNVRILVKDTQGSDAGGQAAAEQAISEGATLLLGPVFSPAVSGAGTAARPAGVPVIAFSTDASIAGRGVYLLSFLPRQDANRIVAFAVAEGRSAIAALVPDNGYGLVMEAAFREAVARSGARAVAIERYTSDDLAEKAAAIARNGQSMNAVFVPNGGSDPAEAVSALLANGVQKANVRLLGSGQWDSASVIGAAALAGSWYPGPAQTGFQNFSGRYRSKFGTDPPRTASLVYDAVMLANGLVQARGPANAFTQQTLTNADGFLGVDGIFRLRSDGLSERGLAVYEIGANGTTRVVGAAPTRFSRGEF